MNYLIWKGIDSKTIKGLMICELPPITKPKMRVQETAIDGVDGSIIEELGYETYDKSIRIGLTRDFDIDEVIKYFTGEGNVVFSNEPSKYYKAKIIEQIDYERLLRFREAVVKFRVQPFKYEYEEEEQIIETGSAEGTEIKITDAKATEIKIDGRSIQETRSGKNLYDATVKQQGGSTNRLNASNFSVLPNTTYTLSTTSSDFEVNNYYKDVDQNNISESKWVSLPYTFTTPENCYYIAQTIRRSDNSDITPSDFINVQLEIGSTATDYEPYGASPSPDYPSEIESVGFTNLFDKDNANILNAYLSSEKIVSSTSARVIYIPCHPNTTYKIQKVIGNAFSVAYTEDIPNIGVSIIGRINTKSSPTLTITTGANAKYLISQIMDSGDTLTEEEILNSIQIEKGSISHSYIPFGKSGIEVKTVGKNLFDGLLELGSFNSSGVSSTNENCVRTVNFTEVKPNATYTISNDLNYQAVVMFYDENKNFIQQVSTNSFTISSNVKYIKWRSSAGNVENNLNVKYMLEEGSEATQYEPYKSNTTVIELNEPLRSLPNGTKDIAYIKNNKLYVDRYVGSVVLDGSEEWIHYSSSAYPFRTIINDAKTFTTSEDVAPNVFCNNYFPFAWGTLEANRPNYGITSTVSNTIVFRNIDIATLDNFKTWLSNNNVQVDYELATPITEELGDLTILELLDGVNNISNSENANMVVDYVDNKMIINNLGNHTSKPIFEIEGAGNIKFILNGYSLFSYNFDADGRVVIDSEKEDAYLDAVLKNRNMNGEFPKLEIGENIITWDGLVKNIKATKKSRWL